MKSNESLSDYSSTVAQFNDRRERRRNDRISRNIAIGSFILSLLALIVAVIALFVK